MAHRKLDHLVAAGAASLAVLSGDTAQPLPLTLDQERHHYAARYDSCQLAKVVDQQTTGLDEQGEPRSAVRIDVILALTGTAKQVREKYRKDDTIRANHPHGLGTLAIDDFSPREAITRVPVKRDSLVRDSTPLPTFPHGDGGPQSFMLYPHVEHPVGQRIDLYVASEANTDDTRTMTTTRAWTDCGSIVLKAGEKGSFEWVNDPSAQIDPPIVETTDKALHN